jgi:hypothetical protein
LIILTIDFNPNLVFHFYFLVKVLSAERRQATSLWLRTSFGIWRLKQGGEMKGVWYSTIPYRTVPYGPRNPISRKFSELKNHVSRNPGPQFFGPTNFTGPTLREQGEAHQTTSELTTLLCFSSFSLWSALSLFE